MFPFNLYCIFAILTVLIFAITGLDFCTFTEIFWTGDIVTNGFRGAFINGNITLEICMGFMGGVTGDIRVGDFFTKVVQI